ncbi:unnamed protein product [Oppiella nova]|uniref:Uncharacterized protein n=1 Tax=Oppiella nova TaxID=334625 RepID=A0A7R9MD79_9ACAR|nr:unnamed protein product [Oppiella nova]CAG2173995.1 unnamed protein product [Oppiella nova]
MFCCPMISCDTMLTLCPVIMALFWPFVASIYGSEAVLRQSLIICLYFVACDLFRQFTRRIFHNDFHVLESFANIVILIALFSQTYAKMPSIVIQCIGFMITNCEPLIVYIEMRQLVRLVMACGQWAADTILSTTGAGDDDRKAFVAKVCVLTATTVAYALAFFVVRSALINAQTLLFTYAAILLIAFQVIQIMATIHVEEGIISDPALVFLMSSLALYLSVFDDNNKDNFNTM